MNKRLLLPLSLGVSLLIWSLWSWPLPRYADRGIPFTHSGGRGQVVLKMEAGDHLQLLYHFWLLGDMLRGKTPWMHNPYEFHTGDEAARREPGAYYAPFSWIYALLDSFTGRALAYNLSGLVSIWLTYLFTWLLVRRYLASDWLAGLISVIAIILPYRWITLLGGSPTGFGMAVTPFLLYGLDRAVRDGSLAGGIWAGLGIVFSYTSDLHIFLFNVLLTPAWCLFALLARKRAGRDRRWLRALLPVAAGILATVIYSRGVRSQMAGSIVAAGRTLDEVGLYAPRLAGVLGGRVDHVSGQVFLGYTLTGLFLIGFLATAIRLLRERPRPWRGGLLYAILLGGVALIVLLAVGPYGPHGGFFWRKARDWVPHYKMIRQTGKACGILPPLLALLAALACNSLGRLLKFRAGAYLAAGAVVILAGIELGRRIDPIVCLLAEEEPVYAAVAADAAGRDRRPHVLVIPLWPGNSHHSSRYQYYCSLYRIRMINGYKPVVESAYYNDVYLAYQSINQGCLGGGQADSLQKRGVTHLILHEDTFPEQVSPFPHGYTITSLLANPRLELLSRQGPVWAFRIVPGPAGDAIYTPGSELFPAGRHWIFRPKEGEKPDERIEVREDPSASRGNYLALLEAGAGTEIPARPAPPAPALRWRVRLRGRGVLISEAIVDHRPRPEESIDVDTPVWEWVTIPIPLEKDAEVGLRLTLQSGNVDLCSAFLTAGRALPPAGGETVTLPAAGIFHRGSLDTDARQVHFRRGVDRPGFALHGPQLPFPEGDYEIGLVFASSAPDGTLIGSLQAEQLFAQKERRAVNVVAGEPALLPFTVSGNLPLNALFFFTDRGDIAIEALTFRKREKE